MRSHHFRTLFAAVAVSVLSLSSTARADVVVSTMTDPRISITAEERETSEAAGMPAAAIALPFDGAALPPDLLPLSGAEKPDLAWQPQAASFAATDPARSSYRLGEPVLDYTRAFLDDLAPAEGGAEWKCLTEALYFEARGETVEGIFAVAEVILNRVDSSRFPSTVCGVVRQGTGRKYQCQFSYLCDGRAETVAEPHAYRTVAKVARLMLDGAPRELTDGAQFYHTRQVSPRWSRVFDRTTTIGAHHFYAQG